ncbi:MAG TPA: TetR family transcriptional regulator [Acidimicrobiia bacterium]|nr:TetR family transcriptional regulator [Acidimicrobiia bacterium]
MADVPAGSGLRQMKKERTRQELAAAALQLFEERGYEAVKVEDIAEVAQVSERTFFRYFATKEEALWPDLGERMAELAAVLACRPKDEPLLRSLRHAAVASAETYQANRAEMLPRFRLLTQTPALRGYLLECLDAWEDVIAGAISKRLGARRGDELRSRLLAAGLVATFRVAVITWVASEGRADLPHLAVRAIDSLAADLTAEEPGVTGG